MAMKMHKMSDTGMHMYRRFTLMMVLSFVAMYGLMYAMVNTFANALPSFNQLYMAGLMTAPMAVLEMALMGGMYPNKKANVSVLVAGLLLLVLCWLAIREQVGISDRQFLKSMVPHHAGAILMCRQADLHDPEVQALCSGIVKSQQAEIDLMKARLAQIDSR